MPCNPPPPTHTKYYFGNKISKNEVYGAWKTEVVRTKFWWGNPKDRDSLEDLDIDRTIILKQCSSAGQRQMAGAFEWGNKPSVSIKCLQFLD